MNRLAAVILFATLWIGPVPAQESPAPNPVFGQIEEIVAQIVEVTGLEQKHPIPYATIGRGELKDFLEERVREEIDPEEIRIEEMVLKKFGFVPRDFDLRETMIELYAEQAAAFYDFHRKKLFLLESGDESMQEAALVHELAHALADQHFRLERFLSDAGPDDDSALARVAVMEGQATWLMAESLARNLGQSLTSSPETVRFMSMMIASSPEEFPVFGTAPRYIRESLTFPYTGGMKLQQAVVERHGKDGFALLFRRPPATTREVLHPEVYFAGERHTIPKLPKLRRQRGYRRLAEGTVGEFDYAVLLHEYTGEESTRRLAPAWRGGVYRLLERKKGEGSVLAHASVWESEEHAREFLEAYGRVLEGKWDHIEWDGQQEGRLSGTGDDGHFAVRLIGRTVIAVEGMRSPDEVRKWPQPRLPAPRPSSKADRP